MKEFMQDIDIERMKRFNDGVTMFITLLEDMEKLLASRLNEIQGMKKVIRASTTENADPEGDNIKELAEKFAPNGIGG